MKCQQCGAELEDGVLFCRECGAKVLKKKAFCRECGARLRDGAKFCSECGAIAELPQVEPNNKPNKYRNNSSFSQTKDYSFEETTSKASAKFSERGKQFKKDMQSSFGNMQGRNKKKGNNILASLVAVLVFVFLIFSLSSGHGGSSDDSSNNSSNNEANKTAKTNTLTANGTFDVIVPETSETVTIEPGTEYAYMVNAWNVYIAKAVSDNVIKVESWDKTSQSDKTLKYRGDLGSFRIRDEENGFSWIDDAHTAFTLTIQDKNIKEVKKPTSVVFTIDISDSDKYKGTDYDDRIACYTYTHDDWHEYRAIALTDTLVKIECWYRTSSGFFSSHCFGWDVGVIDTEHTSTDFEWGDASHKAFSITMKDPANSSWKEERLTSFLLQNEKYKFATVQSFLGKDNSQESTQKTRPQKEGFDAATNDIYYFSQYSVEIPSYWTNEQKIQEGIQRYAETGSKIAMLQIQAGYDEDEDYPVTFDGLMSDVENLKKIVESSVFSEVTNYEVIDTGYVKGVLFTGRSKNFQGKGLDISGKWFSYASEEDRYWCNFICAQSDNTEYLYDDDFMKIINSIRPKNNEEKKAEIITAQEETPSAIVETTSAVADSSAKETASAPETTAAPKEKSSVSYSTNDKSTVKNGNQGVYAYKSRGGTYDNYYLIDFDEGYVYFFSDGNGDTNADRVKIDSGNLNDVLIITYHDGSDKWSYGFHFKWKNPPDHLILQDQNGFEYDFYSTNLNNARSILAKKKIYDY